MMKSLLFCLFLVAYTTYGFTVSTAASKRATSLYADYELADGEGKINLKVGCVLLCG